MFRLFTVLSAAALLTFTLPLAAEDKKDDKKKTDQKSDSKPANTTEYVTVGEFDAIISSGLGKDNSIAIRRTQITAQFTRRGRIARINEIEDDPTIELTTDVKVRMMQLPPKTDEKGKKIPYTEKEIKELKGDSNLKGYKADVEDLKPGKIVTLRVVRLKGAKGEEAEKRYVDRVYIKGETPITPAKDRGGERKKDK